jgi:EAL domain-containing protein (putative c-di-GMP-specific phosphodiesterase class I)
MDDFGTGYSSLSYLASIKFDKIKIDRSLVANLGTDEHVDAIVSMIIGLGRSLQVSIIAEGVETEMQRVTLRAMGRQFGQGYLFGKPAPLAQLTVESLRGAEAS